MYDREKEQKENKSRVDFAQKTLKDVVEKRNMTVTFEEYLPCKWNALVAKIVVSKTRTLSIYINSREKFIYGKRHYSRAETTFEAKGNDIEYTVKRFRRVKSDSREAIEKAVNGLIDFYMECVDKKSKKEQEAVKSRNTLTEAFPSIKFDYIANFGRGIVALKKVAYMTLIL